MRSAKPLAIDATDLLFVISSLWVSRGSLDAALRLRSGQAPRNPGRGGKEPRIASGLPLGQISGKITATDQWQLFPSHQLTFPHEEARYETYWRISHWFHGQQS